MATHTQRTTTHWPKLLLFQCAGRASCLCGALPDHIGLCLPNSVGSPLNVIALLDVQLFCTYIGPALPMLDYDVNAKIHGTAVRPALLNGADTSWIFVNNDKPRK